MVKVPKQTKRYCPKCKVHTDQKITLSKNRGRNASRPLSKGSKVRVQLRGQRRGAGNQGKYSKPTKPKMSGKKLTKKSDFRYKCSKCNKTSMQSQGKRAKKIEFV
jgi:large subunit ribosomal protein L44e